MNDEEESEIIPFSSSRSTPPGRLTLNQYTDILSKKMSAGEKGYIDQFEDWLMCDKWTELDACYILAGMIPKTMKPNEENLIRIKDGNKPAPSDIEEYHRIKGLWENTEHERANNEYFIEPGEVNLAGTVRPIYAYLWSTEKGLRISWMSRAVDAGLLKHPKKDLILSTIEAQAEIHHKFFVGLQLKIILEQSREKIFDWSFLLFRSIQEKKFASSLSKLDLEGLPDAVACARYHVLSNTLGGVSVEYMEESNKKAWVRFRYPRWIFTGPAICGIPIEVSRGFLKGWYAHNGIVLRNPKLGFVCVSEDMTGQFGLCGYFKEYDRELSPDERLQFKSDEIVPKFCEDNQPNLKIKDWGKERLTKTRLNYSVIYFCHGLIALCEIVGKEKTREYGAHVGRLIGAQYYQSLAQRFGLVEGGPREVVEFMSLIMQGLGDKCADIKHSKHSSEFRQRIPRFLHESQSTSDFLILCWIEIWKGMVMSHRVFMEVICEVHDETKEFQWTIRLK